MFKQNVANGRREMGMSGGTRMTGRRWGRLFVEENRKVCAGIFYYDVVTPSFVHFTRRIKVVLYIIYWFPTRLKNAYDAV